MFKAYDIVRAKIKELPIYPVPPCVHLNLYYETYFIFKTILSSSTLQSPINSSELSFPPTAYIALCFVKLICSQNFL